MPTTTPAIPAPVLAASQIRRAEKQLKKAGFDPGKVDGKADATLAKAVKQFQSSWGMPADGELNARTLARLQSTAERIASHGKDGFVSVGQKSNTIKTLEQRLARLGYDVGRADGIYSRDTAEAVKKFRADQKELGAKNSGSLGKEARTVLRREVEALKHAPERRRVKSTAAQQRLDSLTAKAVQGGLAEGARGPSVANIQKHLRAAGFDPKNVAGVFDERTAGAVKNFQLKAGLKTTGVVNPATWAKLKRSFILNAKAPLALHERSGKVKSAEQLLKKAGFKPGRVDGLFDRSTEAAVKRFEQKHDLRADGRLTPAELKKLKVVASRPAGTKRVTGYVNGSPRAITVSPVGNGKYLRTDAAIKFNAMKAAAAKAGISLSVVSGFRTQSEQIYLYNLYLSGRGNLAARPGYSNHQGGLSADLNTGGYGTAAYRWLSANARRYGFVNDVGGEHWHWTFKG